MINKHFQQLEFDQVLIMLEDLALSEPAKRQIRALEPFLSEKEVAQRLEETTEAKEIMEQWGTPPLSNMTDLEKILELLGKDTFLMPEQLEGVAQFLITCRRLKSYLKKAENVSTTVSAYGSALHNLTPLVEEIHQAIRNGQVDDKASPALSNLRRKLDYAGDQIKSKLDALLRNNKQWFSEGFVSMRNGHYTLPVKKEYKAYVQGTVIDTSRSGGTLFIEPNSVSKYQEEMAYLKIEEDNEVRRILYALTASIEEYLPSIKVSKESMECLDYIFAKAKLSFAMKANPIPVTMERRIEIIEGRHPLLDTLQVIPLNFQLEAPTRGIVITGPNTGGKTVALKTIGLLSVMAQSGLHVPATSGHFTMTNYILCDIGDGQSISANLSTFSSHIKEVIQILNLSDSSSLILLDELGSGTDPAEGMGLAIAILEALVEKNCLFIATTHYPEVKDYAKETPTLLNARMAFDHETLQPLYQLELGEAGESCALYIAKRLGLPAPMVARASQAAYGHVINEFGTSDSISSVTVDAKAQPRRKIIKSTPIEQKTSTLITYNLGDSVMVLPNKQIGIVFAPTNDKGEVGVQIQGVKQLINHKRLKLHVSADKLYPKDYDFSLIFDSVETRKKRHQMSRKHDPHLTLELDE